MTVCGEGYFVVKMWGDVDRGTPEGKTPILPIPELGKTCSKYNLAIPEEGKTELQGRAGYAVYFLDEFPGNTVDATIKILLDL